MEIPLLSLVTAEGQSREVIISSISISEFGGGFRGVEVSVEAKMELQRLRVTGQGEYGGWGQVRLPLVGLNGSRDLNTEL